MSPPVQFDVLLPAAGSGTRFAAGGGGGDKLLTDLHERTVLQRSVALFAGRADVRRILIVTAPERFDAYRDHLREIVVADRLRFVAGGRERWESVLLGLRFLAAEPDHAPCVAIHDAARPLTPPAVIDAAFRGAIEKGGSVPCVAEPATLKRQAPDGTVDQTVDRRGLFQAQTPQCFALDRLISGYEQLLQKGGPAAAGGGVSDLTDDAQVFERMGWPVAITPGSPLNLKITTAADVALARAIAAMSTQV